MQDFTLADPAADHRNMGGSFDRSTRNPAKEGPDLAPARGMFAAAQAVAHVAQTVEGFFEGAFQAEGFSMDWESMDRQVRAVPSLTEAHRWLHRAFAAGEAAIVSPSPAEWEAPLPDGPIMGGAPRFVILGAIRDHAAHHRGALAVCTRRRGKVPPMPSAEAPEG